MTPHVGWFSGFWGMYPAVVAVFVLLIDFGMVNLMSKLHRQFSWEDMTRYKSFCIGDSILLPVYAGACAIVFRYEPPINLHTWFLRPWFQLLIFTLAPLYAYLFEGVAIMKNAQSHGNVYHYAVAVIVSYLIMTSTFPLLWSLFKGSANGAIRFEAAVAVCFILMHIFLGLVIDGNANRLLEPNETVRDLTARLKTDRV